MHRLQLAPDAARPESIDLEALRKNAPLGDVLHMAPQDLERLRSRGLSWLELGEFARCEAMFELLEALDGWTAERGFVLSLCAQARGDEARAKSLFERAEAVADPELLAAAKQWGVGS